MSRAVSHDCDSVLSCVASSTGATPGRANARKAATPASPSPLAGTTVAAGAQKQPRPKTARRGRAATDAMVETRPRLGRPRSLNDRRRRRRTGLSEAGCRRLRQAAGPDQNFVLMTKALIEKALVPPPSKAARIALFCARHAAARRASAGSRAIRYSNA